MNQTQKQKPPAAGQAAEHTPGPFKISPDHPLGNQVFGPGEWPNCQHIASCTIQEDPTRPRIEVVAEAHANAVLFAAAPDLLAALERAVKYLDTHRPKGKIRDIFSELNEHENDVLKPARAALIKAKGGT